MAVEMRIEPAGPPEQELLWDLMREFYAGEGLDLDETRGRAALARLLGDESLGRTWIIQVGAEAAGYLVLTFGYSLELHGRDAWLDELFLREAFRGQGIGRRAIAVAEQACRALEVSALHLEVERKNAKAQGFYSRLGFRDHDRSLMTKRLEADQAP